MKVGWNLCMNRDKLWVKVIQAKYKCGVDILPTIEDRRPRTNLWCGIVKNWENLMPNLIWRVGNGRKICFWEDIWVPRCGKHNNIGKVKPILGRIFQYVFSLMQHVLGMWKDFLKFFPQTLFIKSRFWSLLAAPMQMITWSGHSNDGQFSSREALTYLMVVTWQITKFLNKFRTGVVQSA